MKTCRSRSDSFNKPLASVPDREAEWSKWSTGVLEYWVLERLAPILHHSSTPLLSAKCPLRELCCRGHRDFAVGIQCPELGLSAIRRWVSRDGKLSGIVNLARAFKIKGFQLPAWQLLA